MTQTINGTDYGARLVAQRIREGIAAGRYVAGQRLVETDLTDSLGTTRTLVRAAIAHLAAEGLVERRPHRGARVRSVSIDEAVQITEVRAVLEGLCAAKAATSTSEQDRQELREIGARLSKAAENKDGATYTTTNRLLHQRIIEMSGQEAAAETLQRLRAQVVQYQFQLARRPGRPQVSLPELLAVIEAVCSGDAPGAEAAMRAHLDGVATAISQG